MLSSSEAHSPAGPDRSRALRTFARHQASSLAATLIDFSVMIATVDLAGFSPALGTACGATCGGISNFLLGRHWAFAATHTNPTGQALRYFITSTLSMLWNVVGVHVLSERAQVPYVAARLVTALTVSILWNFPLHRHFVFPAAKRPPTAREL